MKTILFFSFWVLFALLVSCTNDHENVLTTVTDDESALVVRNTRIGSGNESETIFQGKDIQSFNLTTGEIQFTQPLTIQDIRNCTELEFCLNGKRLFNAAVFVSDLSSAIVNDLVLYFDLHENKTYLKDGFPSLEALDDRKDECGKLRETNRQLRVADWEIFINWLKINNKLIEENEPILPGRANLTVVDPDSDAAVIMFSGEDIRSFNTATGELLFNSSSIINGIKPWQKLEFRLDGKILFTVDKAIGPWCNNTINDLVFYSDILTGEAYLLDGFPALDRLSDKEKAYCKEEREANFLKRAEGWKIFINWLETSGKLIVNPEEPVKPEVGELTVTNPESDAAVFVFCGEDIRTFNAATGELLFNSTTIVNGIKPWQKLEFRLDGKILFTVDKAIGPWCNNTINDLVFYSDVLTGEAYLLDGFPALDRLNDKDKAFSKEEREANYLKRAEGWKTFMNWLEASGKLVK